MENKETILIVEDERPLLEAIRAKLENSGFEAVTARSVEQALQYMVDIPRIQAIWLDHYLLGKESGLDLVATLKSHEEWRQIPVFVVSNTASSEKVCAYMQLGINKYYVKANNRLDTIIEDIVSVVGCQKALP